MLSDLSSLEALVDLGRLTWMEWAGPTHTSCEPGELTQARMGRDSSII